MIKLRFDTERRKIIDSMRVSGFRVIRTQVMSKTIAETSARPHTSYDGRMDRRTSVNVVRWPQRALLRDWPRRSSDDGQYTPRFPRDREVTYRCKHGRPHLRGLERGWNPS
jgi:hypothetical protein